MKKASKIILACCVLHNCCLLNDDYLDVVVENILKVNESQDYTRNRFEILTGDVKRNEILRLLNICIINCMYLMCIYYIDIQIV